MALIRKESFGRIRDGRESFLYILRNTKGTEVAVTNYGARLVSWKIRDRAFQKVNVLLGFSEAAGYEKEKSLLCAAVGQDTGDALALSAKLWEASEEGGRLRLTCAGENGGEDTVKITYALSNDNELSIRYAWKPVPSAVNEMTHRACFHLDGSASDSLEKQKVKIFADTFCRQEDRLAGQEFLPVEGTSMDFGELSEIGTRMSEFGGDGIAYCIRDEKPVVEMELGMFGYDIFCPIDYNDGGLRQAVLAESAESGISLAVYTTLPTMIFRAGDCLQGSGKQKGLCLETHFGEELLPEEKGTVREAQLVYALKVR